MVVQSPLPPPTKFLPPTKFILQKRYFTCRAAAHEDICRKVTKPVVLMRCPRVRYSTPRATRLVVWNAVVPTKVMEDSASYNSMITLGGGGGLEGGLKRDGV